jgi:hypothetical protein
MKRFASGMRSLIPAGSSPQGFDATTWKDWNPTSDGGAWLRVHETSAMTCRSADERRRKQPGTIAMSKPHLEALENAIRRSRWRVVSVHPGDDYQVSATWEIRRNEGDASILIDFDGLSARGDRCLPLDESYGCHVRNQESIALYFKRVVRSRESWERDVEEFVQSLETHHPLN